MPWFFLDYFT